jgi:hypothetical protein
VAQLVVGGRVGVLPEEEAIDEAHEGDGEGFLAERAERQGRAGEGVGAARHGDRRGGFLIALHEGDGELPERSEGRRRRRRRRDEWSNRRLEGEIGGRLPASRRGGEEQAEEQAEARPDHVISGRRGTAV